MTVMVSGGFDPLHEGHVELLARAADYGDVIVALNSDEWLTRKKGTPFMAWASRYTVLHAMRHVHAVVHVDDSDGTVCEALERLRPAYFANGGDRGVGNTPEMETCNRLGIKTLFGLGKKINSSSELVNRQWGHYRTLHDGDGYKVKLLTVMPGKATSLQQHTFRNEHWVFPATDKYEFKGALYTHQLRNDGDRPLEVIEVWTGTILSEDDITRL